MSSSGRSASPPRPSTTAPRSATSWSSVRDRPALAAAVYGASEGMTTTLAEDTALGGQAGTSSRIENYLGFPAGLSGEELTARGVLQAQKFGVRVRLGREPSAFPRGHICTGSLRRRRSQVTAKSVIIATGARYNRLEP